MRWLIAHPGPGFSVHDVYVGWRDALREIGEDVKVFNLDDRLAFYDSVLLPTKHKGEFRKALSGRQAVELAVNGLAAALFKVRPEILLIVSGFFVDVAIIERARALGTTVIYLATESPYEDARQLAMAPHVDLMMINDPARIDDYRQIVKTIYVPHAYRPEVHHPGPSTYAPCDFAFVGTGFPSRVAFLEACDFGDLDVVLAGNWPELADTSSLVGYLGHDKDKCCENAEAAELYRAAKVGMNLYRREAEDLESIAGVAMGPREVEMSACGLFFVRDPRPEGDDVLGMLPRFRSPEEASDLIRYYAARDSERQRLADQAREAIADRTFREHATKLLRLIDRRPRTNPGG